MGRLMPMEGSRDLNYDYGIVSSFTLPRAEQ
jgi:hypothetical protein